MPARTSRHHDGLRRRRGTRPTRVGGGDHHRVGAGSDRAARGASSRGDGAGVRAGDVQDIPRGRRPTGRGCPSDETPCCPRDRRGRWPASAVDPSRGRGRWASPGSMPDSRRPRSVRAVPACSGRSEPREGDAVRQPERNRRRDLAGHVEHERRGRSTGVGVRPRESQRGAVHQAQPPTRSPSVRRRPGRWSSAGSPGSRPPSGRPARRARVGPRHASRPRRGSRWCRRRRGRPLAPPC
jgi:hypothetical protein